MTDKEQIIIDGVDVSGCEYIGFGIDGVKSVYPCQIMSRILPPGAADCRNFPKCQFRELMKQLARKTAEFEELKAYAQRQENQREVYYKEYLKLSQECEELKREIDLYKTWYRAKHDDIRNLLGSYRKALEEIEAVCLEDTYTFADGTQIRYDSLDDILDIINKAKGHHK